VTQKFNQTQSVLGVILAKAGRESSFLVISWIPGRASLPGMTAERCSELLRQDTKIGYDRSTPFSIRVISPPSLVFGNRSIAQNFFQALDDLWRMTGHFFGQFLQLLAADGIKLVVSLFHFRAKLLVVHGLSKCITEELQPLGR
jgi:hypothetical protein